MLVLASASAARAHILERCGVAVTIDPAVIDEAAIKSREQAGGATAGDCALRLADSKARAVAPRHHGALVLGADQILESNGRWYDKPVSLAEARSQLEALNGEEHTLFTAAVVVRDERRLWHCLEQPSLTMRRFSARFLDAYLGTMGARVLATVGGYELEGMGAQLMAKVEGDYFSILGLPLLPLLDFLRREDVIPS